MKRRTLIELLLVVILMMGCGNAKKTKADANASKQETQSEEGTGDEMPKLTAIKLTDKEWLEVKASYDKLAKALDEIMSGDECESIHIDLSGIATSGDVSLGGMILYYN